MPAYYTKRAPWTDEEQSLLARQEARLILEGTKYINQALIPLFPRRTLESIKGQRRKQKYRSSGILDRLLKLIPSEFGEDHFNAFAFANDLIFVASTTDERRPERDGQRYGGLWNGDLLQVCRERQDLVVRRNMIKVSKLP